MQRIFLSMNNGNGQPPYSLVRYDMMYRIRLSEANHLSISLTQKSRPDGLTVFRSAPNPRNQRLSCSVGATVAVIS